MLNTNVQTYSLPLSRSFDLCINILYNFKIGNIPKTCLLAKYFIKHNFGMKSGEFI